MPGYSTIFSVPTDGCMGLCLHSSRGVWDGEWGRFIRNMLTHMSVTVTDEQRDAAGLDWVDCILLVVVSGVDLGKEMVSGGGSQCLGRRERSCSSFALIFFVMYSSTSITGTVCRPGSIRMQFGYSEERD